MLCQTIQHHPAHFLYSDSHRLEGWGYIRVGWIQVVQNHSPLNRSSQQSLILSSHCLAYYSPYSDRPLLLVPSVVLLLDLFCIPQATRLLSDSQQPLPLLVLPSQHQRRHTTKCAAPSTSSPAEAKTADTPTMVGSRLIIPSLSLCESSNI